MDAAGDGAGFSVPGVGSGEREGRLVDEEKSSRSGSFERVVGNLLRHAPVLYGHTDVDLLLCLSARSLPSLTSTFARVGS